MSENKRKKGLGRGLSSLLSETTASTPGKNDTKIAIDLISPNPDQPRQTFPPKEMEELTDSIRRNGILQPLLLRTHPERPDHYQIIAGERRWRAAQAARLHEAPAIIRELSDQDVLEIAIIENVQRADLNPIDEASGYAQLIEKFSYTQVQLAEAMGKSRPYIANMLRLMTLPEPVRDFVASGALTAGHARALITAEDPLSLAQKVVSEGLSVRQTETLAKHVSKPPETKTQRAPAKDADTKVLESDISAALGLKVSIDHKGASGGQISIKYKSLEDLDGICQLLSQ